MAWPPATYDHHWTCLKMRAREGETKSYWKRKVLMFYLLGKKLNPSGRGWQPPPLPLRLILAGMPCLPSNLRVGEDVWTQCTLSHPKIYNNLLIMMMMMMMMMIVIAENHVRAKHVYPSFTSIHPIKYGYDVSVRSPVRTDTGGGGKEVRSQPVAEGVCYSCGEI